MNFALILNDIYGYGNVYVNSSDVLLKVEEATHILTELSGFIKYFVLAVYAEVFYECMVEMRILNEKCKKNLGLEG